MAEKRVHRIDAASSPARLGLKRQVCAYIRVSTGHEKQLDSLENQRQYYERLITSNPKYEFRGIFSDAGISGAKEERPGFSDMLAQAREGNIDVILTKSISRFARNTVLLLKAVRELKSLGVAVVFEEQHINTLSADGELMLSVLASIAEEERKAVCGNVSWAIRSRYKRGEVSIDTNRLLGYDKDENRVLVINEEQADIVRLIFSRYLSGASAKKIAKELNAGRVPTFTDYPWSGQRILRIIGNEKYIGDCLLQKFYVDERGTLVRNRGQIDRYYLSESHPAIVSREDWQRAQEIKINYAKKSYPYGIIRKEAIVTEQGELLRFDIVPFVDRTNNITDDSTEHYFLPPLRLKSF